MRIHRLRFRALGPYPGEHEIDFEKLAVSGLFLLCGPTGTGKSSIIDAITFALYGSIEGTKERLHSDHADPGVRPFAELAFSTSSGLYRVWRSPEYWRPKARGSGSTLEKSDAKLFRLTAEDQIGDADAGESIVGGPRDVGAEIQEIIGLTKEQFLQTIVLPQGEFARFLTTRPDDRRTLLQSIFATRVYQNTQEALRERAREARGRVEEARRTVGTAVQNLWGEREDVPEIGSATWIDSSVLREAAAALVAGVRAEAARVEAEAQRAADVACQAQGRLDSARALEKLLARQASALAVLRDIEERAESIATDRERLERAKTATGLRSLFGNADSAARAAAGAAEAVARARAVARAEVRALDDAQLAGRRDALNTSAEGLRSSLKHEDAVREFEASLVRLGRDSAREVAALDSKKTARAGLPGQREALSDRQSAARTAEARLPWHKQRVAELERVAKRLARIARLDGELTNARTAAAAAKSAADDALAWETAAREGWFNGLAGELAGQLTADEPCLVCGSLSHPAPARRPEDAVSKAEMQRAGKERVAADEVASTALQKVARLAAQQGELRSQMGDQDVEAIASDLTAARGARAEDVAAAASLPGIEKDLEDLAKREENLDTEIAALDQRIVELESQSNQIKGQLIAARSEVERARGTYESVAAALSAAESEKQEVEAILNAAAEADRAERARQSAVSALEDASRDAKFADVGAARAALLPVPELIVLEARVNRDRDARTTAEATLTEQDIAALTGEEAPEVESRVAERDAAASARDEAKQVAGAARQHAEDTDVRLARLEVALSTESETSAGVRALVRMADVAQGNNSRSMQLATYVLLRRFEEVIRAANVRLGTMSDGRYELRRCDEEGGQRARGQGLGLEVMDYKTGKVRSPHTLSGGETFYTSLSLALGLADVVTDESGGIHLGTLFVDEGFGTLDDDTLEKVMTVLQGLTANGRAVGIVSHVTELRRQIHEQIQVDHRSAGAGSALRVVA